MIAVLVVLLASDLAAIQNEPDPNRRALRAVDFAHESLGHAREAGNAGDPERLKNELEHAAQGIELALTTYRSMKGKFGDMKKTEVRSRDLVRKIEALRRDLPVEDRPVAEAAEARIIKAHDELLLVILGKRR